MKRDKKVVVLLSEDELTMLDAMRGECSRSGALRELFLNALQDAAEESYDVVFSMPDYGKN